jgi:hypothetical protein
LAELARLEKSPDELVEAVELLGKRRGWAKQLAMHDAAEKEYPKVRNQIEKGERELESLIEKHHEKMNPVHERKAQLIGDIQSASGARQDLINTAHGEANAAATAELEQKIQDTQHDKAELVR